MINLICSVVFEAPVYEKWYHSIAFRLGDQWYLFVATQAYLSSDCIIKKISYQGDHFPTGNPFVSADKIDGHHRHKN